jgi:hypothetical protein
MRDSVWRLATFAPYQTELMWWSHRNRPATEGEQNVARRLLNEFPASESAELLWMQLRQGPLQRERKPDGYVLHVTQTTDDLLVDCEAEWQSPWATVDSDAGLLSARVSVARGGFLSALEIRGVRHTQWAVEGVAFERHISSRPSEPPSARYTGFAPPELRELWSRAPVAGLTYEVWPAHDAYETDGSLVFGRASVEEELLIWRAGLFATHTGTCAHASLAELLACLDGRGRIHGRQ